MLAASHEGEHFLSWTTEDFTQGKTAKLHTQGAWRFQRARFWHKTMYETHRNQSRGFVESMHWKIQPMGYRQKYNHKEEDGKIVSLVCFLLCWSSMWGSSSHRVDCSQLSDSREHRSQSDSSTFCPHYRALHVSPFRNQCLNNHQPTESACGFQNPLLSSKFNKG